MTKEQLRKIMEDCWDAAHERGLYDNVIYKKRFVGKIPDDKEQWITTRLSALDDGDGWAVETLIEVSKILVKYHLTIGETEVGNHCFNIIREAAFKNKTKGFPDNITK